MFAIQPCYPHPGDGWRAKDTGDFDGDGRADILWQHDNGTAAVWRCMCTAVVEAQRLKQASIKEEGDA